MRRPMTKTWEARTSRAQVQDEEVSISGIALRAIYEYHMLIHLQAMPKLTARGNQQWTTFRRAIVWVNVTRAREL